MLKQAVSEVLEERRDLLYGIVSAVLEDRALAEAIREGQETERVERTAVFDLLGPGR